MIEIVPATAELLARYGAPTQSLRGVCAVEDDEVLGYAGVALAQGAAWAIAEFDDRVRARPRVVVRAMRRVEALLGSRRIYALADPELEGSRRVLRHLGFRPHRGDVLVREG